MADLVVRPVASDEEAERFLRATPNGMGLPTWEPEPAAWWSGPGLGARFGGVPDAAWFLRERGSLPDRDRTQAAFVGGELVGTSGLLSLELTVPGPRTLPMGGVTWVGVHPTHRRQGLLRAMMRALLDDGHRRGEAVAALSASEGGIYGRFGFGPATTQVRWELSRGQGPARPASDGGRLALVGPEEAGAAWAALHEEARRTRVGEVSAYPGYWDTLAGRDESGRDASRLRVLHCDSAGRVDGGAAYRIPWSPLPEESGLVQVDWLEAVAPSAYTVLWSFLSDQDLTRRVAAGHRPVDEPLRWQLRDPRALRVTRLSDNLWVRLIDVGAALAARRYAISSTIVLEVADAFCPWNAGRWILEAGPDGSRVARAGSATPPDIALDVAALGAAYLGGVSLLLLARAGLVQELAPRALAQSAALFSTLEAPHNAIGF